MKLNWKNIFKFSALDFIAVVTVSTVITMLLVNADKFGKLSMLEHAIYFQLPSLVVMTLVLILFAKVQDERLFLHMLLSHIISNSVSTVIMFFVSSELVDWRLLVLGLLEWSIAAGMAFVVKEHWFVSKE